ncbi:MAG: hypothetical protein EAX96_02775 [Candidatus Lokiarchaeota archaeon]|nr:hypothetical protein [Candidatus Lokiarchaeota archaeon]
MATPSRKSQSLQSEINEWASNIKKIDSKQDLLIKKILSKVAALIESKDLADKANLAKEIEDFSYDIINELEELMSVMELIGGIEREIVDVNPVLEEIKIGRRLTEKFRISIKNLVKSSFDSSDIKNEVFERLKNHYKDYKEIANRIRENSYEIIEILNQNLSKFRKL